MRSLLVIVPGPYSKYSVELRLAEADEVIEAFVLAIKAFHNCIDFQILGWSAYASHIGIPEIVELIGKLAVPVPDQKRGLDARALHPLRGIPGLLHYPLGMGMIGARTAVDLAAAQIE